MKSTWFGCKRRYEFARAITSAGKGHDNWRCLGDWLTMAQLSLSQAVHKMIHGDLDPKREEEYEAIAKNYDRAGMAAGMGVLVDALEERAYDFLGTVTGELGALDKDYRGQVFTPHELAVVTARMMMADLKPGHPSKRIRIQEPACGAGSMVIAAADVLKERGFYPWHYWIDAIDVDHRMFCACYIQMTLLGIPGAVHWGNTLSMKINKSDATFVGAQFPWRKDRDGRNDRVAPDPVHSQVPGEEAAVLLPGSEEGGVQRGPAGPVCDRPDDGLQGSQDPAEPLRIPQRTLIQRSLF